MRPRAAFLLLALAAAPLAAEVNWGGFFNRWRGRQQQAPGPWAVGQAGSLQVQLMEGGLVLHAASGAYYPTARLNFRNMDAKRRFQRTVTVEFLEAGTLKLLSASKTALRLEPSQSLSRLYRSRRRLSYAKPEDAPPMLLRVKAGKFSTEPLPVPASVSPSPPAP